ncbi:Methyltransferase domain-containing protein [Rhizobium sp. RU33A]|uniref:class I SAM-dependent methyltransferase n=1 Tax=Rhizobium sp. RU33A TaxID=1907413 RepID=UPI0009566CD8|nr:methyltransferase domain-containing protein [Rhizobium sp. RU33A]SIR13054.1 Methyltransferase domain-containing protein [Rhizobium sp. RU33A]
MALIESSEAVFCIDRSWSDSHNFVVQGWAFSKHGATVDFTGLLIDGLPAKVVKTFPREDVKIAWPQYDVPVECGFVANVRTPIRSTQVRLGDAAVVVQSEWGKSQKYTPIPQLGDLYSKLIKEVEKNNLVVLEVGSRVVGNKGRSGDFVGAKKYIGMDYHPGENVDVVGDAHYLSKIFEPGSIGAVFSTSVLEHVIFPWVVASEIHKILKVGGVALIDTPFVWPTHERPADFWRFTDMGLAVLFSGYFGWEIEDCGLAVPVSVHPDSDEIGNPQFPWEPAYGASRIYARKVREFNWKDFRWEDADLSQVFNGIYPTQSFNAS